jgi:hypothetical protein
MLAEKSFLSFLHSTNNTNLLIPSAQLLVVPDTALPAPRPALDTPFPAEEKAPPTALPAADFAALACFPTQLV